MISEEQMKNAKVFADVVQLANFLLDPNKRAWVKQKWIEENQGLITNGVPTLYYIECFEKEYNNRLRGDYNE